MHADICIGLSNVAYVTLAAYESAFLKFVLGLMCTIFCVQQAENRATEYERNVTKLQKEVDKLEGRQQRTVSEHLLLDSCWNLS